MSAVARVTLINPSYRGCYADVKASVVDPIFPTLALATIAAGARERGHEVRVLDLSWRPYEPEVVAEHLRRFRPDVVGITGATPLVNQMRDMSVLAKDVAPGAIVVGGGPHASALPRETLRESLLDAVVVGEGDETFRAICDGEPLASIAGVAHRAGEEIVWNGHRPPLEDLDLLPMPAWDLYDHALYARHTSRLFARRVPFVTAEFSRGCVFSCDYCASKNTLAMGYRKKSPERCAEEVRRMHALGIREFMLADDIFTSDERWAAEVCEAILRTGVDMAWTCTNGIRVESADPRLFALMRRAGCYRVAFGFESGNDAVLKRFGKGGKASVEKARLAVTRAREAGIETLGYFMLGLSADDRETMRETVELARELPLDMLKFSKTIAFPGTPMFADYARRGLVKSYDWDDFHIYTAESLFNHPTITNDEIVRAMSEAYRRAILLNPGFILRRALRGVRTGEIFWDAYYFLRFLRAGETKPSSRTAYYARERWPVHSFEDEPPASPEPQKVTKLRTRRAAEAARGSG